MRRNITWLIVALALSFTACGSGGGTTITPTSTIITAVDGYIKDAYVTDDSGQVGVYSSNGQYTFANPISYPLHLTSGVLEDTNTSFDINMTAQSGTIISPITAFINGDASLQSKLALALSLPDTSDSFAVDFVDTDNTNLAKLAQLLYAIQKNINLTAQFKASLAGVSGPTDLFTLAEGDVNATIDIGYIIQYRAFLHRVKNLSGSISSYETGIKSEKYALNIKNSITHNGFTYASVTSPDTGKIWLDRNIGASQVCTALNDTACYGDYYQWGRNFDGHQISTSSTTTTQATNINNAGTKFITNSSSARDWTTVDGDGSLRISNWSKTDGSSVCPVGYRVPTIYELLDDTLSASTPIANNIDAFNSFLKLPSPGYRKNDDGSLNNQDSEGIVWSSTTTGSEAFHVYFGTYVNTWEYNNYRAIGFSVRCISDAPPVSDITPPTFTSSSTASVNENQTSAIDLNATDDVSSVTYSISGGESADFDVNVTTGVVRFKIAPDFETKTQYTFTATVTDTSSNSATQTVTITILDLEPEETIITHNGFTYGTVISPYTSKIWLDRNIGASQICTALDDAACYGNYYQWGRNFDGHQISTSLTTTTLATDINSAGIHFITNLSSPYDWTTEDGDGSLRSSNWSETDGSSVCPVGYSVPTIAELDAETKSASLPVNNTTDAFNSFLKLPSAGGRKSTDGSLYYQGSWSLVWSSSVNNTYSYYLHFNSNGGLTTDSLYRAYGFSVRCISDAPPIPDTTPPIFTSSDTVSVNENQTNAIDLNATDNISSVTYSISGGDSADFNINATTGIVTFKVAPDFENKQNYSLTATSTDDSNNTTTQSVAITILDVEPEPIIHNGVTYNEVTSPYTGEVWLDRNLGASRVCLALNDTACYGDYYQWGRNFDGHQISNSATTTTLATDITNVGSDFIISADISGKWTTADSDGSLRSANWSNTDGSSVCPIGYRVPTITELTAETILASTPVSNNTDAFNNFLKLPSAGSRRSGLMSSVGTDVDMWSSSANGSYSEYLYIHSAYAGTPFPQYRAYGGSIRCIKD